MIKAIIVPGNGGDEPDDRWRPYIVGELGKLGIQTINVVFPDPVIARKKYWLPYLKELGADENTILIGHSSGAVAAMRYAENNKILGSVLIGACYTNLGLENEKESGYYVDEWDWSKIRGNQKWIIQFHSTDDPFVPIQEARYVHEYLGTEYYEYNDRGHFLDRKEFPELIDAIKNKI